MLTQFFKKVHSTKPAASRNESAEIFVVCLGYKAPDKIDPRFLDPKHVFSEVDAAGEGDEDADAASNLELVNPEKKKKKPAAEGYETGATVLYKSVPASEFITGDKAIHILNNVHAIELDETKIRDHPKTTAEITECCKDVKVLGMKELRLLKRWREALRKDFEEEEKEKEKEERAAADEGEEDEEEEDQEEKDDSDEELKDMDAKIAAMKDEERRLAKRAKKKASKEKRKTAEKINLKMILPGDEAPVREEEGLFRMRDLRSKKDVEDVTEKATEAETLAESEEEEDSDDELKVKLKSVPYKKEKGRIDKSGLFYKESDSEEEESSEEEDDEGGELGLGVDRDGGSDEAMVEEDDEEDEDDGNPLLMDLDHSGKEVKKKRRADLWFDKDVFKNIEEDEDLAEEDIAETIKAYKKKNVKILSEEVKKKKKGGKESDSDDSDSGDEDDEDEEEEENFDAEESYRNMKKKPAKEVDNKDGFEVVPKGVGGASAVPSTKKRKKVQLTPEELAMGQEMIMSKKRRRDLLDAGWNRFMFNDRDEDLPDWFVKEERLHMRPHAEATVDPKVAEEYRQRQKELNVKTIKKVVEAKARKKRKAAKRMDKARKKAAALMENPDVGSREKAREIQRMYKRAATDGGQKKEVAYVVARKHTAAKRARRPAGVKGAYKQVDPRMKKDTQGKRGKATGKRVQKRRLKGKKTKPTRT